MLVFGYPPRSLRRARQRCAPDGRPSRPLSPDERQILVRIEQGGLAICEAQLRYQLETKDEHPLAGRLERLDVLAELEQRGLIESALHFRLTARGRAELPDGSPPRGRAGAPDGIPWTLS